MIQLRVAVCCLICLLPVRFDSFLGLALEPGVAAALNPPELPALRVHRAEMSPASLGYLPFRVLFRDSLGFLSLLPVCIMLRFLEDFIGVGVC